MDKHFQILLLGLLLACVYSRCSADQSQTASHAREKKDILYNSALHHHELNHRRRNKHHLYKIQEESAGKYSGDSSVSVKEDTNSEQQINTVDASQLNSANKTIKLNSTKIENNPNRSEIVENYNDQSATLSSSAPTVVVSNNSTKPNRSQKKRNNISKNKKQSYKSSEDESIAIPTKLPKSSKHKLPYQNVDAENKHKIGISKPPHHQYGQKQNKKDSYGPKKTKKETSEGSHSFSSYQSDNSGNYSYDQVEVKYNQPYDKENIKLSSYKSEPKTISKDSDKKTSYKYPDNEDYINKEPTQSYHQIDDLRENQYHTIYQSSDDLSYSQPNKNQNDLYSYHNEPNVSTGKHHKEEVNSTTNFDSHQIHNDNNYKFLFQQQSDSNQNTESGDNNSKAALLENQINMIEKYRVIYKNSEIPYVDYDYNSYQPNNAYSSSTSKPQENDVETNLNDVYNIHGHFSSLYNSNSFPVNSEQITKSNNAPVYQNVNSYYEQQGTDANSNGELESHYGYSQPITSVRYINDLNQIQSDKLASEKEGTVSYQQAAINKPAIQASGALRFITQFNPTKVLAVDVSGTLNHNPQYQTELTNSNTYKTEANEPSSYYNQIISLPTANNQSIQTTVTHYGTGSMFSVNNYPYYQPDGRVEYKTRDQEVNLNEYYNSDQSSSNQNSTTESDNKSVYHTNEHINYVPQYQSQYVYTNRDPKTLQNPINTDEENKNYIYYYQYDTSSNNNKESATQTSDNVHRLPNTYKQEYSAYLLDNLNPPTENVENYDINAATDNGNMYSNGWRPITNAPNYQRDSQPNSVVLEDLYFQRDEFDQNHKNVPVISDRLDNGIEESAIDRRVITRADFIGKEDALNKIVEEHVIDKRQSHLPYSENYDVPTKYDFKNFVQGNLDHTHYQERRDGANRGGKYYAVLPDSTILSVKYTAPDDKGSNSLLKKSELFAGYEQQFQKKYT